MSSQEYVPHSIENKNPPEAGGIILGKIKAEIAAQAVEKQISDTSSAIRLRLWPFMQFIDPAAAIAELEDMRAANDNQESLTREEVA